MMQCPKDSPGSQDPPVRLQDYVKLSDLEYLIRQAIEEDLGDSRRDVTTSVCVPQGLMAEARMKTRQPGIVAGLVLLPHINKVFEGGVTLAVTRSDGDHVEPGDALASFHGPLRSILQIERTALNFVTHLSGIATMTRAFVDRINAVEASRARICDTRKTLPGWRGLQKYAVACGGGVRHRDGLYDAVLIKDNHIAHVSMGTLHETIRLAVKQAHQRFPNIKFVEVEVDHLHQLEQVLGTGIDIVLLDNMSPELLRLAVAMRDRMSPGVLLEASGGVTLETVGDIAASGVERISVGALTHSPPALDIGLDLDA